MIAKLASLLAVAGLSAVQAQVYDCDTYLKPYYPACDRILAQVPWAVGVDEEPSVPSQTCLQYFDGVSGQEGNCVLHFCNYFDQGGPRRLNELPAKTNYGLVKQWCEPMGAGGQSPANNDGWVARATNDADSFAPQKRSTRRSAGGKVTSKLVSIGEFEEYCERAKNATIAQLEDSSFKNDQRSRGSDLQKRQGSWQTYGISRNVRQPGVRDRMSGPTSPGVSITATTTEGFSASVGVSVEVGVSFFEIFSASAGVDVSSEYSMGYSFSREFDPASACESNQQGVLYFYPMFDHYVGAWSEQDGEIDVWIPVENASPIYDVECLG